jgi:hypothetical protein
MSDDQNLSQAGAEALVPDGNDGNISAFRIDVPDSDLLDLRERLAHTRWPGQVAGTGEMEAAKRNK